MRTMVDTNKSKPAEEVSKRNWADEDDDAEDGDDVEIGGSSVAQVGKPKAAEADGSAAAGGEGEQPRTVVPNKPRTKRERNIHGDFVVTKINIKEREIVVPQNDEEEEESSEEESEEEKAPEQEEPEKVKKGK